MYMQVTEIIDQTETYRRYDLNLEKVKSIDDCKKILKFLSDITIKPLPNRIEYGGFYKVREYYE